MHMHNFISEQKKNSLFQESRMRRLGEVVDTIFGTDGRTDESHFFTPYAYVG